MEANTKVAKSAKNDTNASPDQRQRTASAELCLGDEKFLYSLQRIGTNQGHIRKTSRMTDRNWPSGAETWLSLVIKSFSKSQTCRRCSRVVKL